MKEEWLHKVHDRMTDYEIDEPEKLWDAIESGLAEGMAGPSLKKKAVMMVWVKRSIAAAAMIAVVLSLGFYLSTVRHDIQDVRQSPQSQQTGPVAKRGGGNETAGRDDVSGVPDGRLIAANRVTVTRPEAVVADVAEIRTEPEKTVDERVAADAEPDKKDSREEETGRPVVERVPSTAGDSYIAAIVPRRSGDSRMSVSIYSTGGTGSAMNINTKGDPSLGSISPDGTDWADNPMLGILLFNKGRDIKTDIKHRLPIRAGVSFAYNLNDRLALESGLSYTSLISDTKEGSDSYYYTGEQKLQYVGVPLNLKYRVFSWNRVDLYASAGVLAEKCVSAKLDKEYVLNNETKSSESEKLSERPFQMSVNASVGVQCNLVKAMSVFVEPGLSYYFDDGTDIETIYKDKPLNFNLNVGLRFTFGK